MGSFSILISYCLVLIYVRPSHAFWRMACSVSQTSRIDPILSPGGLSGHVHKFAGGNSTTSPSRWINAYDTQMSIWTRIKPACWILHAQRAKYNQTWAHTGRPNYTINTRTEESRRYKMTEWQSIMLVGLTHIYKSENTILSLSRKRRQ